MQAPRSWRFAYAGDTLDKREYIDKKAGLLALTDFLKHKPPTTPDVKIANKEQKGKNNWIMEMFTRSGSKRVKRSSKGNGRSSSFAKKVDLTDIDQVFESEKKYEQMAAVEPKEIFQF